MLLLIALAQAAPPVAPSPAPSAPHRIDLTQTAPCEPQAVADADVIVCGRRGDDSSRYRLPPLPPSHADDGKAQWQVGKGARMSAETEQADVGGTPSNRVMLRLTIKF